MDLLVLCLLAYKRGSIGLKPRPLRKGHCLATAYVSGGAMRLPYKYWKNCKLLAAAARKCHLNKENYWVNIHKTGSR
jgi:hypothetical protein